MEDFGFGRQMSFLNLFGHSLIVDFEGYFEGVYRERYVLSSTMIWTLQLNCRYRRYEVQNEVLCPNVASDFCENVRRTNTFN